MEENNKDFSIDTENLKKETSTTINEVKETIKKVNIKDDTEKTKGVLINLLKNPINEMKEIANSKNAFFSTAIVLLFVWTVAVFIRQMYYVISITSISSFFRYGLVENLFRLIMSTLAPTIGVILLSVIILVMNKSAEKSLVSIVTTVVFANIPVIIAYVINLITIISSDASRITSPFSSLCHIVSIILLYFGIKELFKQEDDNKFMKTFVILELIYFAGVFILSFLGIDL